MAGVVKRLLNARGTTRTPRDGISFEQVEAIAIMFDIDDPIIGGLGTCPTCPHSAVDHNIFFELGTPKIMMTDCGPCAEDREVEEVICFLTTKLEESLSEHLPV